MKRFKEKKKIQNWKERESSSGQSSDVATHSSGSSAETPVFFFFFNTTLSLLYCIKESKSLSFTVLFRSVVIFFSSIKIRPPKRASLEQVSSSLYSLSLLDFFVFFYSFFFSYFYGHSSSSFSSVVFRIFFFFFFFFREPKRRLQSQPGNEATLTPVCRSFLNRQKTRTGHPSTMIHPYNRARKRCAHYYWMGLINCVVVVAFKTNSRRCASLFC